MRSPVTKPKPTARRNFFWLAFAISFVLLSAVSCGGLALLVGLDANTLADLQAPGPAWTPPPAPTALPADMTAPAALPVAESTPQPGRLQPGISALNVAAGRVNIRRTPGYLGKGDDDIVAQMEQNTSVTILEWPQIADQLTWWRVRVDSAPPVEGWVAESTASGVQILRPE